MGLLKKITVGIGSLAMVGFLGYVGLSEGLHQHFKYQQETDKEKIEYVEKNTDRLIRRQQAKLGIRYKTRPRIAYEGENLSENLALFFGVGFNYREKREIQINLDETKIPSQPGNDEEEISRLGRYRKSLDETLDHELFHHYTNDAEEQAGIEDKIEAYSLSHLRREILAWKISEEGMAKYVELTMNEGTNDFNESRWPRDWDSVAKKAGNITSSENEAYVVYYGGAYAMAPILEHGSKGIDYVIKNRPRAKDLQDHFKSYQAKALQELSKPQKNKIKPQRPRKTTPRR